MTFAEAVRQSMEAKGMKARELSEASGLNEAYISRILSGNTKDPAFIKAVAIINALGEDLDEFVEKVDL